MNKTEIRARLEFRQTALTKLRAAYLALVDGGVKSYTLGDRQLTRLDLDDLQSQIEKAEREIDELSALAESAKPRRAARVIPMG